MTRHRNLVNAACVLLLGVALAGVRSCAAQLTSPDHSALIQTEEALNAPSTAADISGRMATHE